MYQENSSGKFPKSPETHKQNLRSTSYSKTTNYPTDRKKKQSIRRKLKLSDDQQEGRRILRSFTNKCPSYNFIELQNQEKKIKKSRISALKQNFDYNLHTFNYDESDTESTDTNKNLLNESNECNVSTSSTVSLINSSLKILNDKEYCSKIIPVCYIENESNVGDTQIILTKDNTTDLSLVNKTSDTDNNKNKISEKVPTENEIKDIDSNNNKNNNSLIIYNEDLHKRIQPIPLQIQYFLNKKFITQIKKGIDNNLIKLIDNNIINFNNNINIFENNSKQIYLTSCNNNSKLIVTKMKNINANNNQNNDDKSLKIKLLPRKNSNIYCNIENIQATLKSELKKHTINEGKTFNEYKLNVSNKIKMLETFGTSVSQQSINIVPAVEHKQTVNKKFIRLKPIDDGYNGVLCGNVKINFNVNLAVANVSADGAMQQVPKLANITKKKSMTSILKTSPNKPIINSLFKVNKNANTSLINKTPIKLEEKSFIHLAANNKGTNVDNVELPIIDVETVDNVNKSPEFVNKEIICCKTPPTESNFILLNKKRDDMTESSKHIYSRFFSKDSSKINKPATICKRNTDNISIVFPNNHNNNIGKNNISLINKHIRPFSKSNLKEKIVPYTPIMRNYNNVRLASDTKLEKVYQIKHVCDKCTATTPVVTSSSLTARKPEKQHHQQKLTTVEKVQILNKNYQEIKLQLDEISNQNKCVCNIENYIKNYYEFTREPAFNQYLNRNNDNKWVNHCGCIAQHFSIESMFDTEYDDEKALTENNVLMTDDSLETLFAMPTENFYQTNNDDNFNIRDYLDIF